MSRSEWKVLAGLTRLTGVTGLLLIASLCPGQAIGAGSRGGDDAPRGTRIKGLGNVDRPSLCALPVGNPGFEQTSGVPGDVPGWNKSQHSGVPAYEMSIVDDERAAGRFSFRMRRVHEQVYGELSQKVAAKPLIGKNVRLSAMLKTDGVGKEGWLLLMNVEGNPVPFLSSGIIAHARSEPLIGTHGWRRVETDLRIPEGARLLRIGAILQDSGTGWLDEVCLHVED